jgi:hypothetical protein
VNVARLCEALAYMQLPLAEKKRLASVSIGLPNRRAPAFLDDVVWHDAKLMGLVKVETRACVPGDITGTDGTVLVITQKGLDFLRLNSGMQGLGVSAGPAGDQ